MTIISKPLHRAVTGLWWVLCLGIAAYAGGILFLSMTEKVAFLAHHLQARPLALITHIALSGLALALLPFQFSSNIRQKWLKLHRWTGRVYGFCILAGGVAGFTLALTSTAHVIAQVGFAVLAVVWVLTTGLAIWHVRSGKIAAHREWMLRSASLTFAAVTLRLLLPAQMVFGVPMEIAYPIVAWACWVPNLLVVEWWLGRKPVGKVPIAA